MDIFHLVSVEECKLAPLENKLVRNSFTGTMYAQEMESDEQNSSASRDRALTGVGVIGEAPVSFVTFAESSPKFAAIVSDLHTVYIPSWRVLGCW